MKDLLLQYAQYNIWANTLIVESMLKLPETSVNRTINSSFQSISATTTHCWSAEDVWLQRLMKVENPIWAASFFKGSFEDACSNWLVASQGLEKYVEQHDEATLQGEITYKDMQQVGYTMPVYQLLIHVFNHATYHRGQLITMLRQVGEDQVPRTDFIVFARKMQG